MLLKKRYLNIKKMPIFLVTFNYPATIICFINICNLKNKNDFAFHGLTLDDACKDEIFLFKR